MSLFSRLLNLNTGNVPLEDFFTEIVAYLFDSDKLLLLEWIDHLNLFKIQDCTEINIDTQRSYSRLDDHFSDSRPDMVIELSSETQTNTIFIESKIGSSEGFEQLSRYAEILSTLEGRQNKAVLYITRNYDPKDVNIILKRVPELHVLFKQLRWYEFFDFLKVRRERNMVKEVIAFMKRQNMAHNNCFAPADLLALNNFSSSFSLMHATLWERVKDRFSEVVASPESKNKSLAQLRDHNRYIMYAYLPHRWWCGVGFCLDHNVSSDYPRLALMMKVDPNSTHHEEILKGMKQIRKARPHWTEYDPNDSKDWAGIGLEQSIQAFLGNEDHVFEMQEFFIKALDELSEIKLAYPELPWKDA